MNTKEMNIYEVKTKAMQEAVTHLETYIIEERQKRTFTSNGREHSLTCSNDCMVGSSQATKRAAERVLNEAQESGDYHREQAAAKLYGLVEAHEMVSARFAEFNHYYSAQTTQLAGILPGLSSLIGSGEEMWEEMNKNKAV